MKRHLAERAAKLWDTDTVDVAFESDVLKAPDGRQMTVAEPAPRLNATGGPVVGRATVSPRGVGNGYACHIVDIEIDPETAKVQVLRYTALQDVGRAIHPSYVEGQIQGGVAQGLGWALYEEYVHDESGRMEHASFLDYRMPTTLDVPPIETMLVEVPSHGQAHELGSACPAEDPRGARPGISCW